MNTTQNTRNNRFNFFVLLVADFVSSLGSSMTGVALTLVIYENTGNLMASALFSAVLLLPQLVIAPFIGRVRFNLPFRMLFSIGEILCIFQIVALMFIRNVIGIYVLFFAYSGMFFILECLRAEYLKVITPDEELQKRQGISRFVNTAVTIIGPLASGIIITKCSVNTVYLLDIISYAIAASVILLLRGNSRPSAVESEHKVSIRGLAGIRQNRDLFTGCFLVTFIGGATSILTLEYIYGVLKADAFHYSVLMTAMAIGGLLGNAAGALPVFRGKLKRLTVVCIALMGILLMSVLLRPGFIVLTGILVVSGILSSLAMLYFASELFMRSSNEDIRQEYAVFQNIIDLSGTAAKPFGAFMNNIIGCVYSIAAMGGCFLGASGFFGRLYRKDKST